MHAHTDVVPCTDFMVTLLVIAQLKKKESKQNTQNTKHKESNSFQVKAAGQNEPLGTSRDMH